MAQQNLEVKTVVKEKDNLVAGLDISKLVLKAQDLYGKKEKGLAKQITTGTSLVRPTEDKDFVVWTCGDHWKTLALS